jgi:starch synthase
VDSGRDVAIADETPISRIIPFQSQNSAGTRILFVTSEITDLLKAGGLGEISAALPRVLGRQGLDVRVLLPGYRAVMQKAGPLTVVAELPAEHALPACKLALMEAADGLLLYVVICPELYDRAGSPYGDENGADFVDNDLRFARLGLVAAEIAAGLPGLDWQPDLVHANDWPTALAPAYMAWRGVQTPSIMTVHNLAYQGVFDRDRLGALGIPDSAYDTDGVEFYGKVSFLKAGLYYASHLTTVSPTYAREILTPEQGCGLDGLLRHRAGQGRLTGILNGIDDSYDPQSDPHLNHHFDATDFSGKQHNASDVRRSFGLEASVGPLFAVVSRLVHQKGVDLVVDSASAIIKEGGQVVATGQGEPELERALQGLAERNPGQVGVRIGFDETLARRMYAGSDFLLMPSRFEPCGLSQMYAQRFGSLPIARNTGGLADTIQDNVTGFLFDRASATSLRRTIHRALRAFRGGKVMERMKSAAMRRPVGWDDAATEYQDVYSRAIDGVNAA